MDYFAVLGVFIGPWLVLLGGLWIYHARRKTPMGAGLTGANPYIILLAHVFLAVTYTTPWDNYLVATNVWWYDEEHVIGLTLGYVPIEEYTFFVVQTLFTGLLLLLLAHYFFPEPPRFAPRPLFRRWSLFAAAAIWFAALILLVSGWRPGTYLALTLVWAFVPIMIQLGFGADILLARWRLIALCLFVTTTYLCTVDALAIVSGTWTIDPEQSTGIMIGGVLPLEEMIFFWITNVLVTLGVTLMMAAESQPRAQQWMSIIRERSRQRLNSAHDQ